MRLLWKYIRNYFLVYHLISHFLLYLQNYKEVEAEILDLQIAKIWAFIWYQKMYYFRLSLGDENVIGIKAFNTSLFLMILIIKKKRFNKNKNNNLKKNN